MNLIYKRHSKTVASFFIVLTFGMLFGCSDKKLDPPKIDSGLAFKLVKDIVKLGSRPSGSEQSQKQVDFISQKIREYGVECKIQSFNDSTPDGIIKFQNIIVDIPGQKDQFIIIGCHYDTKKMLLTKDFSGANDGASGVGLLLAMIKSIAKHKQMPEYSLRFIFFDGEECINSYTDSDGLHGSRYYAKELARNGDKALCRAVIIADMIGDKELLIETPSDSEYGLKELLISSAKRLKSEAFFKEGDQEIVDDHTPFQKIGIPAIDIIDFNYGPGNSWWHSSEDTVDKIDKKSFQIVGNVLLDMIWRMPEVSKK